MKRIRRKWIRLSLTSGLQTLLKVPEVRDPNHTLTQQETFVRQPLLAGAQFHFAGGTFSHHSDSVLASLDLFQGTRKDLGLTIGDAGSPLTRNVGLPKKVRGQAGHLTVRMLVQLLQLPFFLFQAEIRETFFLPLAGLIPRKAAHLD